MNKRKAFTLFEMLLVLLVTASMIIGGIILLNQQKEDSAADVLGMRLYQYGIAIAQYAAQNPEGLQGQATVTRTGYQWLQAIQNPYTCQTIDGQKSCQYFLGQDFNLQIPHIELQNLDTDGNKLITHLRPINPNDSRAGLKVELVQVGNVLTLDPAHADDPAAPDFTPDPALSAKAIRIANNFSSALGTAKIQYSLDIDDAQANIEGRTKEEVGAEDAWLLTSGGNTMKGPIGFDAQTPENLRLIQGVHRIEFEGNNATITNVKEIQLKPSTNNIGETSASTYINTLVSMQPCTLYGNDKAPRERWLTAQVRKIDGVSRTVSFCALTGFDGEEPRCQLSIHDDQNGSLFYYASVDEGSSNKHCTYSCLVWDGQANSNTNYCTAR